MTFPAELERLLKEATEGKLEVYDCIARVSRRVDLEVDMNKVDPKLDDVELYHAILSTLRAHKKIMEGKACCEYGSYVELCKTTALERAETAERQLAKLQAKHDALVKRLREPTDEMLDAGHEAGDFHILHYDGTDKPGTPRYSLRKSWIAMSAVALREGEK